MINACICKLSHDDVILQRYHLGSKSVTIQNSGYSNNEALSLLTLVNMIRAARKLIKLHLDIVTIL